MDKNYTDIGAILKPALALVTPKNTAFSATPSHAIMLRKANLADVVMLNTRQVEQQFMKTRMLLQKSEKDVLDDAYLAAANASSSGSKLGRAPYLLMEGRLSLYPRMQARLQQRGQLENGLLPPHRHSASLVRSQHLPSLDLKRQNLHDGAILSGPPKKRRVDHKRNFGASQAPDPLAVPKEEEKVDPVAEKIYDDVKGDKKPRYAIKDDPFPLKIYRMLEEAEENGQEHILSFLPHGRVFAIHNPNKFMEDIMPTYFSTTRMSSFQRQLNMYGFRRITEGPDKGGFHHKSFLKGKKELVEQIKRKKPLGPNPTQDDVEDAIRAYQRALSGTGFSSRMPASQLMVQNSSRQHDLISQMMNIGGQRPRLGNSLAGQPPRRAMDVLSDPRTSLGSLIQGGNGAMRNRFLASPIGTSEGLSGNPTAAMLLLEQKKLELYIVKLQQRKQQMSDLLQLF
jgi:hypothetical protein